MDLEDPACIETSLPGGVRFVEWAIFLPQHRHSLTSDRFYSSLFSNRLSEWQAGVRRPLCARLSTDSIFASLGSFVGERVRYDQSRLFEGHKRA